MDSRKVLKKKEKKLREKNQEDSAGIDLNNSTPQLDNLHDNEPVASEIAVDK